MARTGFWYYQMLQKSIQCNNRYMNAGRWLLLMFVMIHSLAARGNKNHQLPFPSLFVFLAETISEKMVATVKQVVPPSVPQLKKKSDNLLIIRFKLLPQVEIFRIIFWRIWKDWPQSLQFVKFNKEEAKKGNMPRSEILQMQSAFHVKWRGVQFVQIKYQ